MGVLSSWGLVTPKFSVPVVSVTRSALGVQAVTPNVPRVVEPEFQNPKSYNVQTSRKTLRHHFEPVARAHS